MKTIIVSGALANKPFNGGNAWSRLNWILGLKKLGFEVCFVEQISRSNCVNAAGALADFADSVNLAYFRAVLDRFGLSHASALIYEDGKKVYGPPLTELLAMAQEAILLFNFSGHLTHHDLKNRVRCKLYYDDDPGFTQFWHAAGDPGPRLNHHDFYFTIGRNIGAADCVIPTSDITWRHTRPPVVLDQWDDVKSPENADHPFDRFTTVGAWRGPYGPVQYRGKTYGVKGHEFRKFIELPQRESSQFELALNIHPADHKDLEALRHHGWQIVDPKQVADSPDAYRHYVQTSGAEVSAAQGAYVQTNSGWFSDRTACYLASGKPALVQDTGLARHYPLGEGLLAFRTIDEAVEGAQRIVGDYPRHCRAARRLAEDYFDSDKVVGGLLEEIGITP